MCALLEFPSSWRDFVNGCDISESDTKIQSAIWELVTTEVDYIHAIQTVTDVSFFIFLKFSCFWKEKDGKTKCHSLSINPLDFSYQDLDRLSFQPNSVFFLILWPYFLLYLFVSFFILGIHFFLSY